MTRMDWKTLKVGFEGLYLDWKSRAIQIWEANFPLNLKFRKPRGFENKLHGAYEKPSEDMGFPNFHRKSQTIYTACSSFEISSTIREIKRDVRCSSWQHDQMMIRWWSNDDQMMIRWWSDDDTWLHFIQLIFFYHDIHDDKPRGTVW